MKHCLPVLIMLALANDALAASNAPAGGADPHAGSLPYVEAYDGPATAFRIVHQGRTLTPTPFLALSPGDTVMVVAATDPRRGDLPNLITLYDGERTVELGARDGQYCIGGVAGVCSPKPGAVTGGLASVSTIAQNVLQSAGRFLGDVEDAIHDDSADMTAARGGGTNVPIVVPLLETPGQQLVSGQRALGLEWKGGQPPFRVAAYRAGSQVALETLNAVGRAALFPELTIPPGSYRFEIADAAGHHAVAAFEAVPAATLPAPTADESAVAADESLPAPMRTTLGAVELVQRDPHFGFEAYVRVAPLARTYRPADLLRYYLANPD